MVPLKISHKGTAKAGTVQSTLTCMPSGPQDLLGFNYRRPPVNPDPNDSTFDLQSSHQLQIWIILLQLFDSDSDFFKSANRKVW